jgi:hypothetical protein
MSTRKPFDRVVRHAVRVIRALYRSAKAGPPVRLAAQTPRRRKPTMRQGITRPAVRMPRLVHAAAPSG